MSEVKVQFGHWKVFIDSLLQWKASVDIFNNLNAKWKVYMWAIIAKKVFMDDHNNGIFTLIYDQMPKIVGHHKNFPLTRFI